MSPRALYRYEGAGAFRAVNTGALLQLNLNDDSPTPAPDPMAEVPATITHGSELPATSSAAEQVIGAQGNLDEYMGPVDITAAMGKVVIENQTIYERNLRVRAGADVTLRNVRLIGPPGSSTYTARMNEGGNARLLLEDTTVVCRSTVGSSEGRFCVAGWGDTSLALRRTIIRGGIDGVHFHGKGPAIWPTGDPLIPMATFLMEECWLGDNERLPGSHSDLRQSAGTRPNRITNYLERRNRFMGYSLSEGQDALTSSADPATSGMASCCWINSTGSPDQPAGAYIALRKNWFEGGNNIIEGGDSIGPCELTDNLFAPRANYRATSRVDSWLNVNNRWAASGTLGNGTQVVGGELIPGSTE